jgi:hypothetical protein
MPTKNVILRHCIPGCHLIFVINLMSEISAKCNVRRDKIREEQNSGTLFNPPVTLLIYPRK